MTRHHHEPDIAGSGPDAGAVGEPALVEPGLDPGGLHPNGRPQQIVSSRRFNSQNDET